MAKDYVFTRAKWFPFIGSGALPGKQLHRHVLAISIIIFGLTLFTNQYFHGGVFGTLHNKSVKPKVMISDIRWDATQLTFQLYRVEGADVYGSFLISIELLDAHNTVVKTIDQDELAKFPAQNIHNHYVAKIKPGKHSLILPLGAKADIAIDLQGVQLEKGYTLKLTDISGITWQAKIPLS